MPKILLLLLLLMTFAHSHAQSDSLQQEILNYEGTKSQIISRGRSLLLDKFLEEDMERVKAIKTYLMREVENNDYLAIYPGENWLLLYWTGEYEELLNAVISFDENAMNKLILQIKPEHDMFYAKVQQKTFLNKPVLKWEIERSKLSDVDKDFLVLYLEYLLSNPEDSNNEQERINSLADNFIAKHPNSDYIDYVKENIRFRFVASNWGLAFEFFSGYGFLTGNLSNSFKDNIPMGVAFDVEYKKWTLYLRNYIGFSSNKEERPFNGGVWEKDSQVRIYLPEAAIGYAIVNNERFKISPFAGIGATSFGPTEYDIEKEPGVEEAGLDFTTTYTAGFNIDYKLNWGTGLLAPNSPKHSYWFIRLRYGFAAPQFGQEYSGGMHYVTIGLGGLYRGSKREL
ncbi:hypothetical protein [Salinimicrobium sp. HB62]|uniref:hypothetical protein n=1 Tax=Salinimicrobium sp. HB62 TaxID=3077781 RepID=UPI002D783F7D|nr:hypothetical protein [Salinimicrobium sp. HB62]